MWFWRIVTILFASLLVLSLTSTAHRNLASVEMENSGPIVDNLTFKLIGHDDLEIDALLDNEVDMISHRVDQVFVEQFSEIDEVEVKEILRNGYGKVIINCEKYPLNETALRRAMAFAIDKQSDSITSCIGPYVPLDSCIPRGNPWSIEGQLEYSYYDDDLITGNILLDEAGFALDLESGFRKAPNGEPLTLNLEVVQSGCPPSEVIHAILDGLAGLSLDAHVSYTDYTDLLPRIYNHQSFDMAILGSTFADYDVDWMADYYWSGNAYEPYLNPPKWQNESFDSWRDQLLHGTSYEEVYEAAIEMQRIWVYECPEIIFYQNIYYYACRENIPNLEIDPLDGFASRWTVYGAKLSDSSGGNLRIADQLTPHYNPYQSCSCYPSFSSYLPYDSLIIRDIHGNYIPWLATDYSIETHADNPSIPEGNTRFMFQVVQNAIWSDGVPLTADDIAWTYNFIRNDVTNLYRSSLSSLASAFAPSESYVVLEFTGESYWYLSTIAEILVLPKHEFIQRNITSILSWSPDPFEESVVTSGPFNFTSYINNEDEEYYEMSTNPFYFYGMHNSETTTTSDTGPNGFYEFSLISLTITSASIAVVVCIVILWNRQR